MGRMGKARKTTPTPGYVVVCDVGQNIPQEGAGVTKYSGEQHLLLDMLYCVMWDKIAT